MDENDDIFEMFLEIMEQLRADDSAQHKHEQAKR